MNWKDIGAKLLAGGARLAGGALGTVVGGPAGTLIGQKVGNEVGGMVAGWLGVDPTPEAVAARLDSDPDAMRIVREKEVEHAHELETLKLALVRTEIEQTGATYRKELESEDPFVRRARPTWLYTMAKVWAFQVIATFTTAFVALLAATFRDGWTLSDFVLVVKALAEVNESTVVMWGAALSVVGVYNWRRSTDKKTAAGGAQSSPPIGGILGRIIGGDSKP